MTTFQLGAQHLEVPQTTADFSAMVGSLAEYHSGLREQMLCYVLTADMPPVGDTPARRCTVASMVAEGKFGTLHVLHELLGRPDINASNGCVRRTIESFTWLEAFKPFLGEVERHPNIALLTEARDAGVSVQVVLLARMSESLKTNSEYLQVRATMLFDLFNEGALRGSDGMARQALLDSFSFLPNRYLTADGTFIVGPDEEPNFVRHVSRYEVCDKEGRERRTAGIDKFPSLMSIRGEQLRADGNRVVPSVMIRDGAYVGKRNIFMFHAAVNLAAYIGDDNMIDSHASIASSVQIGSRNKIGSFVSFEGVLSPANAVPVYIGDDNFIGSFARIGTGIVVGNKNFIAAGVALSKGVKVRDCRDDAPTKGAFIAVHELNGTFNNLAIAPNHAPRQFNGVEAGAGEYLLFSNTEEFMKRFEGDDRIKAKA